MDKLREQIAKIICRSKCLAHNDNCQCSTETADAILALLQLRMLSKDEAEKALEIFGEAGYTESHMSCQCLNHRTIAKLKLIQEED